MRRWLEMMAIGLALAVSAFPFVALAPEPPAFGHGAALIVASVAILATMGTGWQAGTAQRAAILGRAAAMLTVTVAAAAIRYLIADHVLAVPTMDLLAKMFDLHGEDIDDAVLYEVWLEIWLTCAAVVLVARRLRRAVRPPRPAKAARPGPWDRPDPPAVLKPRWNAATIVMFLIGLGALGGAVMDGHWTAAFLSGSVHVTGTIADPQPHPIIRFTAQDGAVVQFRQNGFVSRPLGADIPVAYQTQDPAGTAQADTIWVNWSNMLGMLWIGLGFTMAPFFGFRAVFRAGRW